MNFRNTTKQCEYCGKQLKLNNNRDIERKRYCSHACRQRWRYEHGYSQFDQVRHRAYSPESIRKRNLPKGDKACKHCGQTFSPDSSRQNYCKVCVPDEVARRRMWRYSISDTEWIAMLEKQGGACALCGDPPTAVDHCHDTGKVRGLLCHCCNMLLARVESGWYQRAERYLRM